VIFRAVRPVDGPAGVVGITLATNTEVAKTIFEAVILHATRPSVNLYCLTI